MESNLSQERPYVMVKEDKNLTGNARFEGFCIDLLKWIAGQVGFQYAIKLVPDHMYGVYDPETKEWNGIVRELIEKVRTCVILFSFLARDGAMRSQQIKCNKVENAKCIHK